MYSIPPQKLNILSLLPITSRDDSGLSMPPNLAKFEKTLKDRCAQVDDERTANAAQGRRYFQHPAARYAMLDI